MYLGYYISSCTAKNQLTFPNKLKALTGRSLLITNWFENSIIIVSAELGEEILNTAILDASSLLPEARDLKRFFFSHAVTVELDSKNRFVLPKVLREYARIGDEAIFLGVGERIELWDRKVYENYGEIREAQIRETAINHYNRIVSQKRNEHE